MNESEKRITDYIKEHSIDAEHSIFEESCHSVADAAAAAGDDPGLFVKNICLVDDKGQVICTIVKGEDRVSTNRVAKALGIDKPRIASPDEILEKTGYPCGGTPSFGHASTFLIDPRVMEKEYVWTGGGSTRSLMKIPTAEILRANKGTVVRVRK